MVVVRTRFLMTCGYPDVMVDAPNSGVEVTDTSTHKKIRTLRAVSHLRRHTCETSEGANGKDAMGKLRSTRCGEHNCRQDCALTNGKDAMGKLRPAR